MSINKTFKWGVIIGAVIVGVTALGTTLYISKQAKAFDQVFAQGVSIDHIQVGGLTKEEAKKELQNAIDAEIQNQYVILEKDNIISKLPFSEIGVDYNLDETLNTAFQVGHTGNIFEKYQVAKKGVPDKSFHLIRQNDEKKLKEKLNEVSQTFKVEPVNATLTRENGAFITTKEIEGYQLNIDATAKGILEALSSNYDGNVTAKAVTEVIEPEYTESSFKEMENLISSFSTEYNNASPNRNANLQVATKKISGLLLPGETFYLSKHLEPFTEAEGYKNAGVIVNGKVEDGLGGGVCQVASTLYNAVLLTDHIDVTMRQNHSLPVAYVPLGRDATYATGVIDFQFKNNTGYPVYIDSFCANNHVYVNIYAHLSAKPEYDIKFESVTTEVIPAPETKYEDDPNLEEGTEIVQTRALEGKRVKLYKLLYKDGVLQDKQIVNDSYYKPRAAVVQRGTKKKATEEAEEKEEKNQEAIEP